MGLYYLRARYYHPDTGRFISRDPIGQVDDVNVYGYVANSPLRYTDRMGKEKALITDKLIVSIFDLALENTDGLNFLVFAEGTRNGGAFDVKRNPYIMALANRNDGLVSFNGIQVEPSNIGNLLAGFNMKNSYLPSSLVRNKFLEVEERNAEMEDYGKYSSEIAIADEYTDTPWYDKGEEIFSLYSKASTFEEKRGILRNAFIEVTPEYKARSLLEQQKRDYLRSLK